MLRRGTEKTAFYPPRVVTLKLITSVEGKLALKWLITSLLVLALVLGWLIRGRSTPSNVQSVPQRFNDLFTLLEVPITRPLVVPTIARATSGEFFEMRRCSKIHALRLGQLDSQFGLSNHGFTRAIAAAVAEWHYATGVEWFTFNENGSIAVNLLFDGRQDELNGQRLAEVELNREFEELQRRVAEHQRWASDLQSLPTYSVEDEEAISLSTQKLTANESALRSKAAALRERYPPRVFRQAEHLSGALIQEVNLYAYTNAPDLHAVLLHELGHVIGIDHLPAPTAIMHAQRDNAAGEAHLTADDVAAALSLCE